MTAADMRCCTIYCEHISAVSKLHTHRLRGCIKKKVSVQVWIRTLTLWNIHTRILKSGLGRCVKAASAVAREGKENRPYSHGQPTITFKTSVFWGLYSNASGHSQKKISRSIPDAIGFFIISMTLSGSHGCVGLSTSFTSLNS